LNAIEAESVLNQGPYCLVGDLMQVRWVCMVWAWSHA